MANLATFRQDVRAALVARTKELKTSLTKIAPELLGEELEKLMNTDKFRNQFASDEEYTTEFQKVFKKEILQVAAAAQAPAEAIAVLNGLEDLPETEAVVMQVVADEPTEEAAQPAAVEAAPAPAEEVLTHNFYAVEIHDNEAVAIPYNDVEMARAYARRRTKVDFIVTQVATREQYAARHEADSLLSKHNVFDKPYRIGEPTSLLDAEKARKSAQGKPAAKALAENQSVASDGTVKTRVAGAGKTGNDQAAASAQKAPAPAASKPTPPSTEAGAAASAGKAKKPVPYKPQAIPQDGTPEQIFQARLSHLQTVEQYQELMKEIGESGFRLEMKSNHVAVEYLSHYESETYEGGVCIRFRRAGTTTEKVESKVYLHCLQRYYEVKTRK